MHLRGGEVRGGVAQQEQCVEVRGGQVNRLPIDIDRLLPHWRELLQAGFDALTGGVGMDIHEVVVVLEVLAFEMEGGVMVVGVVDPDPEVGLQRRVGALVLAEVPEIDIPAGPMHGLGIIQAQAVPLQDHHPDAVPCIDRRQMADGRPVRGILPLIGLDHLPDPLLLDGLVHVHRHHPRLEQPRIPVPRHRRHLLARCHLRHRRPIDIGGRRGEFGIGVDAEANEMEENLRRAIHFKRTRYRLILYTFVSLFSNPSAW